MPTTATAQKSARRTQRTGSRSGPRNIEAAKPQASLGLPIDPRRLSRPGVLELMRIAAHLSYRDVSRLTGIPRAKVLRLIRGAYEKPLRRELEALRDVCWGRMPSRSPALPTTEAPLFLTLEEAADLLAITREAMRRLVVRDRRLRAIKAGVAIRIPQAALADFISAQKSLSPQMLSDGLSRQELANLLRVPVHVVRYANQTGRIKAVQRGKHGRPRIPWREVKRVLARGTHELRPRASDLPRSKRKR